MATVPDVQARVHGGDANGLEEAWRSRVAGQAAESFERLGAESNLAVSLLKRGKNAEAEPMFRRLHAVLLRVLGAEYPETLICAANLARSSQTKANMPTLSGSSVRCMGWKSACSGPSIRARW